MGRSRCLWIAFACTLVLGAAPARGATPAAFDPLVEASNYSITLQRQTIYDSPDYAARLALVGAANNANALVAQLADPGRFFTNNLCWNGGNGCAGDIRLYDWGTSGYGTARPVLFTARNGATLSGHVWATVAGPPRRPGVVITNGSVQADEQMYWFAAQALAKAGYVVLTFDPQGQGQSDLLGAGPDASEGVPAQTDGRPFFDGTEDAINFFLSTPTNRYRPVASCTSGTSHADKQDARVRAGLDAAYNPFWSLLDPARLGIAGHSYGAAGVSYVGQWDPRVKAIVAWDNLGAPSSQGTRVAGAATAIGEQGCPANPAARTTAPITKPALGMSADYFLPPTPNLSLPSPLAKSQQSLAYSAAGVDTGELVIRGGSHLDFSFIPTIAFGASLRGADEIAWYTTAWFDKYVKQTPDADRRLLTGRWRADPAEAAVDPTHDGNAFSFYYASRLRIHRAGGQLFACEDMRTGCAGLVADDGYPGLYSYIALDTSPDGPADAGAPAPAGPSSLYACAPLAFRLHALHGRAIVRVRVYAGRRLLVQRRGRALHSVTVPGLPGRGRFALRIDTYTRHGLARRTTRRISGCAARSQRRTASRRGRR